MDIAKLGISIDSTQAVAGAQNLDQLTAAGGRTERQTEKLTATQKAQAQAMTGAIAPARDMAEALNRLEQEERAVAAAGMAMNTATGKIAAEAVRSADVIDLAQRRVAKSHAAGAAGAKLQAHEVTNLGRQFADIGVMLGSGQNPFMTLLQQGPQIADILHTSGLSAKQFGGEILAMAAPFAGVAVAAGVAVGAFAIFANAVDDSSKMSLTWGDTWKATVKVVGDALMEGPIGDGLKWLGGAFAATLKAITDGTLAWLDRIVGFWGAAYEAVVKNWKRLPEVLAVIMQGAVNNAIWAVEGLVNAVVKGINKLAGKDLISAIDLPRLKVVSGQVADSFEKDQARIAASFHDGREKMFKDIVTEAERIHTASQKKKKATDDETAATKALRDAMEDLLRTRRAGAALDAAFQKEMNGRPDLTQAEAKQKAEQQAKYDEEERRRHMETLREQERLAESYSARLRIGREIEAAEREQELATRRWTAKLIKGPAAVALEDLAAGYDDFNGALNEAASALDRHDWAGAAASLIASFKRLEWANLSTAGKVGAAAGVAQMAGDAIGGTAGSTLGGAGAGALAGATIGSVIPVVGTLLGAGIGAIIGGIGGFLSGNKKKQQEREAREQAEAQRVADIASQHRQLEIALMEQAGDAVGALAARRADELKGIDASNQALAMQLYAAQDAAEAAAKAKELAASRYDLETELMRAQGNELGAVNRERAKEVEALDDSLRGLQQAVWAAQALSAANDNLAQSLATLADLQQQQALQAQQNAVTALQGIAQAAEQAFSEASARVDDARSALNAAYEKEAGGLQSIIDGLRSFASSVHAFREQLAAELMTPGQTYGATRSAFYAAAANPGDDASGLLGAASTFLDASKSNARTLLDYQRDQAAVSAALKIAEDAAGEKVDIAQRQLDALNASVQGLVTLNASVMSVQDAITGLASATAAMAIAQAAQAGATSQAQQAAAALQAQQAALQAQQQAAALAAAQQAVNDNANAGGFNAASYLRHYTDVQGEYDRLRAAGEKDWWGSNTTFAQWHYDNLGKGEGRTPYALGGAFTNGVAFEPTSFHNSVMGEAGPEAIMPLERGSDGSLGVRARGGEDNSALVEQVRILTAEVVGLRNELQKVTANTSATANATDRTAQAIGQVAVSTAATARSVDKLETVTTRVTRDGEAMLTEPLEEAA